jgi:hypothetical protein
VTAIARLAVHLADGRRPAPRLSSFDLSPTEKVAGDSRRRHKGVLAGVVLAADDRGP